MTSTPGHEPTSTLLYAAMRLFDYTTEAALLPNLVVPDLDAVIERLASALSAEGLVTDPAALVRDVLRREAEAGTALAEGLVLPHATCAAACRVQIAVATLQKPVDAKDGEGRDLEVDVVLLLTAPPAESRHMMRVLARLAREIRGGLTGKLRRSSSADHMVNLLAGLSSDPV